MRTLPPLPTWLTLEHQVAQILTEQEQHGWYFDEGAARQLESTLRREYEDTTKVLRNRHPFVKGTEFTPKRTNSRTGYVEGATLTKLKDFNPTGVVIDTLILSRLYHPNLLDIDKKHAWKHMPLQLYGRHSLEAYGYRLGEYKGSFGQTTDWSEWSQEMEDYCVQDVKVTIKLWKHFLKYLNGSHSNIR